MALDAAQPEMCARHSRIGEAQRQLAEGAPAAEVLKSLEESVHHAERNQLIYQLNYDDNYDATDGLCCKVTEHLKTLRDQLIARVPITTRDKPATTALRKKAEPPVLYTLWQKLADILPDQKPTSAERTFLRTRIGLVAREDFFQTGVVFTVELFDVAKGWTPLFRRGLNRRSTQWETWRDTPHPRPLSRKGRGEEESAAEAQSGKIPPAIYHRFLQSHAGSQCS